MLASMFGVPSQSIEVIPPGVSVHQILNLSSQTQIIVDELNLREADPIMLLPARITRRKNLEFALQITGAIVKEKPQTALIITGPPGPHNPKNVAYLNSLRALREELHLESSVHFLYELIDDQITSISDEIISDLYRFADLLLFPSQREGFGIPILEAGLARTPVFSADIPPVRESSSGYAHLFDPNGDPETIAGQIINFIETDLAHLLRKRVINNFTWQAILDDKIIPLINHVGL
jgi:glycosyltransferase involved in cell wall biosynthesis